MRSAGQLCEVSQTVLWGLPDSAVRSARQYCEVSQTVLWGQAESVVRSARQFCEAIQILLWGQPDSGEPFWQWSEIDRKLEWKDQTFYSNPFVEWNMALKAFIKWAISWRDLPPVSLAGRNDHGNCFITSSNFIGPNSGQRKVLSPAHGKTTGRPSPLMKLKRHFLIGILSFS